jgi:hypothetical protein
MIQASFTWFCGASRWVLLLLTVMLAVHVRLGAWATGPAPVGDLQDQRLQPPHTRGLVSRLAESLRRAAVL